MMLTGDIRVMLQPHVLQINVPAFLEETVAEIVSFSPVWSGPSSFS